MGHNKMIKKIRLGDRIVFKALCRWDGGSSASRLVRKIDRNRETGNVESVQVLYGGVSNFYVRPYEIHKINGRSVASLEAE